MTDIRERIRSTKAQLRIATKQYNQAGRLLARLTKSLEQLEKKYADAKARKRTV
jgi:phage shock protein A